MKKIGFLSLILSTFLYANSIEIENLRTDLYSKSGANVLKKVELSLELEGKNLDKNKIIDSVNTVISGFFYEDIFTELGKNNFKKTLEKFIHKKYKIQVNEIYILSLSGVEKFDIDEFKRFLESSEAKQNNTSNEVKKALEDLEVPQIQSPKINTTLPNLEVPNIEKLAVPDLLETTEENADNISPELVELPKLTELQEKIKRDLIANPPQLFAEKNQTNTDQNLSKAIAPLFNTLKTENNASNP